MSFLRCVSVLLRVQVFIKSNKAGQHSAGNWLLGNML